MILHQKNIIYKVKIRGEFSCRSNENDILNYSNKIATSEFLQAR